MIPFVTFLHALPLPKQFEVLSILNQYPEALPYIQALTQELSRVLGSGKSLSNHKAAAIEKHLRVSLEKMGLQSSSV